MMLPPLGYRGDAREIDGALPRGREAGGLPLMAYNNPEASGIDMPPALIARLDEEVDAVVAVKECSGDARRIPALIDAAPRSRGARRRRRLGARGLCRRRDRLGHRRRRRRFRASASSSTTRAGRATSSTARAIYARLLPLARFDMTPKLVQYFKAAMDEVGFAGGPCRPPRLALTPTSARRSRRAGALAGAPPYEGARESRPSTPTRRGCPPA